MDQIIILLFIFLAAISLFILIRAEAQHAALIKELQQRSAMLVLLSNELRTPLSRMRAYCDDWQNGGIGRCTKVQKEAYDAMEKQLMDTFDIVKRIFLYSRVEPELLSYYPVDIDIRESVQGAINSLLEEVKTRKQKLVFKRGRSKTLIHHDPLVIHAILQPVLENAVLYSPEKSSIEVHIESNLTKIKIIVRDTGIGMSAKDMKKVTEKFYRGPKAKSLNKEGSGLGVYMANQLLLSINGTFTCKSAEGNGTECVLTFPKIAPERIKQTGTES